jgi:dynein assembly factor 1
LDDRPVFDEDRRYAEAFSRGGIAEERKEREEVKKEKDEV